MSEYNMAEPKRIYDRNMLTCLLREQCGEEFAGAYEVDQEDGGSHLFLVSDRDVYTKIKGAEGIPKAIEVGEQRLVSVFEYFRAQYSTTAATEKAGNVMRYCVKNGTRRDQVN